MPQGARTLRPGRSLASDFAGRKIALPDEPQSWRRIDANGDAACALVLGLGPKPPEHLAERYAAVYWLDSPDREDAPRAWRRVEPAAVPVLARKCAVFLYSHAQRLRPDFWGPVIAAVDAAHASFAPQPRCRRVWLPGDSRQLLHMELAGALGRMGYEAVGELPQAPRDLAAVLGGVKPDFAISVNFRGLDGEGRFFGLLRALRIPLAIWLVDNPWNLLAGIPLPWWKEAALFVTDASHIPSLRAVGAKNVNFLPLAAASHMLCPPQAPFDPRPLFVGRSEFPGKSRFFAGLRLPPELAEEALYLSRKGGRPDFHWWVEKLGVSLWPGRDARKAAFGAEEMSARRRAGWLAAAQGTGIRIVGDSGWSRLVPGADILPPVDYYGALPGLYASAGVVLNITSLLLPHSLNQRHFDVWAAGGFLLSDDTPGFGIFPEDLARAAILDGPEAFSEKFEWLQCRPREKQELAAAWRELILREHLYERRLRHIMEILGRGC